MFLSNLIYGDDLSPKTVCLTFDDGPGATSGNGPGPRTLEIAQYLHGLGIQATFFVVGKHVAQYKHIPKQVAKLGHLIGNHTFNHPSLSGQNGQFAAKEILDTHALIAKSTAGQLQLFRPPYGSWDSEVAGQLNWTKAGFYIGGISWHIGGGPDGDWGVWEAHGSAEDCALKYETDITAMGQGIMLMHDSSATSENQKENNRTFETIKILVPWLQNNGYQFVALDSLPQIKEAAQVSSIIALQAKSGHYISPQHGGGGEILANGPSVGAWEPLGVVKVGKAKIALRCLTGHYLSPQNGGGEEILANGPAIGQWEVLIQEKLPNQSIALRCPNGKYISPQNGGGGEILADGPAIGDWEVLRVSKP